MNQLPQTSETPNKISDVEYEQFCELFYRKTGIRFGSTKRYFVDKRILERMQETRARSFSDYLRKLKIDVSGAEMQTLVDSMTVNETYFYRESDQLDMLAGSILPEICQDREQGSEIRIWSMPCSSGEEPYSIALKLLEDWSDVDRFEVSIYGTDIDSKMVKKAKEGLYNERSLHRLGPSLRARYFQKEGANSFRIIDELRQSIDFRMVNALDRKQMMRFTQFDVILCRNMLIYFDDVSRKKVFDSFFDSLRPNGCLLLGASESLGSSSRLFDVLKGRGGTYYRKPR